MFAGLKHSAKDIGQKGQLGLYFGHKVCCADSVGTEFLYDLNSKASSARFGITKTLKDDIFAKVKVDHQGQVHGALKFDVTKNIKGTFVSGLNLVDMVGEKPQQNATGFAFDVKF